MSFSIFAFVKSRYRVIARRTLSGCPNGFRIRIGLSGSQGIDMPDRIAHSRPPSSPDLRSVVQKSASGKSTAELV